MGQRSIFSVSVRPDRKPVHRTAGFPIRFVPLRAGDLLIWNTLLAHGIRPNTSADRVRMAQYVSMYPADERNSRVREARIPGAGNTSIRSPT